MQWIKKYFKNKISDLKYGFKEFFWMNCFFSPFKPPKLKFYFGKIAIGTPYFLPRRAVKDPNRKGYKIYKEKKFGFDFVRLGYKTKWTHNDYRFEFSPVWSFIFIKWQIAVNFVAPYRDHYWECWLYYYYDTDKKLSRKERLIKCMSEKPCIWSSLERESNIKIYTNYYSLCLKDKYKPLTNI